MRGFESVAFAFGLVPGAVEDWDETPAAFALLFGRLYN